MLKKLRNVINRFIEKLAKDNQDAFGKKRLNCCDLSQDIKKKN